MIASAEAAVTYEFRQISQSDFQNTSDGVITGTGIIDGPKSRVELLKGSGHIAGTYIISRNDTQMVFIVDPIHKRFSEVNAAKIASAYGSGRIQITNLKSSLAKLEDHPIVAGLPTDHFRISAHYDITVMFGTLPLTQKVVTIIDKWVTTAFGELSDPSLTGGLRTGNQAVDQLIDMENMKVKGFPLRQVTTIQTTASEPDVITRSKLKMSPTRKQTTELLITRIAPTVADQRMFEVPATYAKAESAAGTDGTAVQMLSMQP